MSNSTAPAARVPAHTNAPCRARDVFEHEKAWRPGGDQPGSRLVSLPDAAWAGVLFVAVDART
ncbi:hypothetical protein K4B79_45255 [Streptomyces lincolnensis]|jgi:hypothetical protein|uniref:hypothetical protein n=1 Tax=Streptomyces lincolnensis TaxID=1915 RepID=UPI001E2C18FD|nr:hypothetical protein [Streptomyces lincolnensis]MCD7445376.1 hypothetical protein [Streptomyces lincolnensis]